MLRDMLIVRDMLLVRLGNKYFRTQIPRKLCIGLPIQTYSLSRQNGGKKRQLVN